MPRTITRMISDAGSDGIKARARMALAGQELGFLTGIDVNATLKRKPGVARPASRILGASGRKIAHRSIGIAPRVVAMRPCNVIPPAVEGNVVVGATGPAAPMHAIETAEPTLVAGAGRDRLAGAVEAI